ncbi:heparan-alpha-glucosaminide N-acetyltransferase [Marinomonas sp. UCMA 3892]|uniref:heparan-alpha-glucosaminide N-acetyltransferase n=1 Tax=Marinomonas sp. UCMA 3892 TaxID=1972585 RepID=UPI002006EA34|nr:heparan-alpha-glucosaminide N-acetyltransferase [Marinomonas sp. UCMA 3892]
MLELENEYRYDGWIPIKNYFPWTSMQASPVFETTKRSAFLDVYRGSAVLLMIIFHFCWDLLNFGFLEYSIYDPFWVYFRSLILTLFLTAIGWSAYIALGKSNNSSFWKRDIKLLISATAISLATYLTMPNQWIYFGILHFIFIASLLIRPLAKWPIPSALAGAVIILIYHSTNWLHFPNAFSIITSYIALPDKTLDIVFPFPWIGVVLIGPLLGYLNWQKCPTPNSLAIQILAFMGRYALPIYLIHQLVLFPLVATFKMVLTLLS